MEYVLGGKDAVERFWAEYYQKRPHVFRREERDASREWEPLASSSGARAWPPISLSDMEEMWANAMRSDDTSAVLTFRDGKQTDVRTPFFAYPHDCSVVVNKSDRFSRAVLELCRRLEDSFPFVFCNVYLTPAASQTVRAHSDDREVLAIQILGRKQWKVYGEPPVALPYKHEEVGKREPFDETTLPMALETEVREGDVLYLPRGFVHQARTPDDTPSLHLTMAIQTSDWDVGAVVKDAVSEVARNATATMRKVLARETLAGAAADGDLSPAAADEAAFAKAVKEAMDKLSLESGLSAWRQRLAAMRAERQQLLTETLRPLPHPVQLSTLVLWNGEITVAGIEDVRDQRVSSVRHIAIMRRPDGQTMPLSLSAATKNVVAMMTTRHTKVPAEVDAMPLRCPLQRLAVACWLLRNGCFVRVN